MKSALLRHCVAAVLALACAGALPALAQDLKGKLVLYTSQPERDAAQTVAAFKKAYPGVDVEVFRSGTTEVMGKLAAEFSAGQPKAGCAADRRCRDDGGAEEGRTACCLSARRRSTGSTAGVVRRRPHLFRLQADHHRHRRQHRARRSRPASWADLAKPEYKGQIAMPSPLYSGAAAIMLGTMTSAPRSRLELLRKAEGRTTRSPCAATAPC